MSISLPLTLRYCSEPVRKTTAWLIAGDEPGVALREWERWNLAMAEWRVVLLGKLGILVILAPSQHLELPANALPLGQFGRAYLPTHAELSCALTEQEISAMLPEGVELVVFLPGESPVAITASSILGAADLLAPPSRRPADWSAAQPGPHGNDRLMSVRPAIAPTIEMIFQAGRDDIGSRDDLRELPPRPEEPGDSFLDQARRSVQQGVAGFFKWLSGAIGSDAAQPAGEGNSWLQSLAAWSQSLLGAVDKETEDLRNREVLRLMEMLRNNPEEGLKYAIPFGGGQGRGVAPPSGQLRQRPVDFNLRNLGGGGPIDYWNIPENYYHELAKQYRALANRELQLGRYRRAAYIFAELLQELHAAASALETGGHWREAAELYKTKLHQPLAAAQCLERGGLLDEAIEIYLPLGFDEKIGDLYARLERMDDAREAWRKAAASLITQHRDYLKAAAIAKDKLRDDDHTLQILDQGWADWNQPGQCLTQIFALLSERGRHAEAETRLRQLQESTPRLDRDLLTAETLVAILASYSDRGVCEKGRDVVQILAGARLRAEVPERQRRWVRAVEALFREDRLVASDGRRFVEGTVTRALAAKKRPSPPGKEPRLISTFQLTQGVAWKTLIATRDRYYAAGISNGGLRLARGDWSGHLQTAMTVGQKGHIADEREIALAVDERHSLPIKAAICGASGEGQFYFGADDLFGASEHAWLRAGFQAGNEAWAKTAGLCYALGMLFEFVVSEGQLVVHGSVVDDAQQTSLHEVVHWHVDPTQLPERLPCQGTAEFLAVGFGQMLHCRSRQRGREEFLLDAPIWSVAITPPFTRLRAAVGFGQGGAFLYAKSGQSLGEAVRFGEDLIFPKLCFTGSGLLVAIGEKGGEIYRTQEGKLTFHQKVAGRGVAPLAVLPVEIGDRFAVVYPSGEVLIYDAG